MIVVPKHTSTAHPHVHGCGTRYVVTRRTDGGLWLQYTSREVERCGECTRTDKAEKAGGGEES